MTAEFNQNVLRVLNRELGADFDVDAFEHVALWDAEHEWIEMRLRAARRMTVKIAGARTSTVDFAAGEEMRTEISAKFRRRACAPNWPPPGWSWPTGGRTRRAGSRCPSRRRS